MKFSGPIPGESLTNRPGAAPWEQPPQYVRVDEVFAYYLDAFEDDEFFEDVLTVLDMGMPLDLFIDSVLVTNNMKGKHTVDMNFLVGPMLHEYLASMAESAGINLIEFQKDLGTKMDNASVDMFKASFKQSLADNKGTTGLEDSLEGLEQASQDDQTFSAPQTPEGETQAPEAPPSEPTGLIRRPQQ